MAFMNPRPLLCKVVLALLSASFFWFDHAWPKDAKERVFALAASSAMGGTREAQAPAQAVVPMILTFADNPQGAISKGENGEQYPARIEGIAFLEDLTWKEGHQILLEDETPPIPISGTVRMTQGVSVIPERKPERKKDMPAQVQDGVAMIPAAKAVDESMSAAPSPAPSDAPPVEAPVRIGSILENFVPAVSNDFVDSDSRGPTSLTWVPRDGKLIFTLKAGYGKALMAIRPVRLSGYTSLVFTAVKNLKPAQEANAIVLGRIDGDWVEMQTIAVPVGEAPREIFAAIPDKRKDGLLTGFGFANGDGILEFGDLKLAGVPAEPFVYVPDPFPEAVPAQFPPPYPDVLLHALASGLRRSSPKPPRPSSRFSPDGVSCILDSL